MADMDRQNSAEKKQIDEQIEFEDPNSPEYESKNQNADYSSNTLVESRNDADLNRVEQAATAL